MGYAEDFEKSSEAKDKAEKRKVRWSLAKPQKSLYPTSNHRQRVEYLNGAEVFC